MRRADIGSDWMRAVRRPVRRRARRGAVLVVVLLGMTLLAGLVFFVYNIGDQVNERLEMQNAADAVAISGAGWMARSMNVVAMNNVAQAKLLGTLPVLDAMPLASRMAHDEVTSWEQCLRNQLDRGVPEEYLRQGLESLRQRMAAQRDILGPFRTTLNDSGFEMQRTTHWLVPGVGGAPPHGTIWQAALTLEEFSQATVDAAGGLAQAEAVRFGRFNQADASFLVPVIPEVPAKMGAFTDFRPVMEGRLHVRNDQATFRSTGGRGGAIPDYAFPHRLGPWARLHRWRDRTHAATGRTWVPPREGARVRAGRGTVNIGGRRVGRGAMQRSSGHGGHWRATGWVETGYTTYGPYHWALRHLDRYANGWENNPGELRDTFFYDYVNQISRMKLNYMFRSPRKQFIHYPVWKTDYPVARQIASDRRVRVNRTMFYLVEIASSVPEGDPRWLKQGTYRTNGQYPVSIWVRGWNDPARWRVEQVADYIWKDAYTYETTQDPSIGILPRRGPDGREEFQPVYLVAFYVFGGIDIGGNVEVSNPANWDAGEHIPAPVLLDTSEGDYDPIARDPNQGIRRERFAFLGVVRRRNRAPVWPERFTHANPLGSTVTLAQAKLFNHTSWDLWTQDWRVQLAPVSDWEDWVTRLEVAVAEAGLSKGWVEEAEVQRVYRHLGRMDSAMADRYINH